MRRHLHALFFSLLIAATSAGAQVHQLVQIESDSFPLVRGRLAPVDADGTWGVASDACSVLEDGLPCTLLSVDCNDDRPGAPLVSVLALDVSESMGVHDPDLRLTQYAARRWVEHVGLGYDRCAVVEFDSMPRLLLPWNSSATTILATIKSTRPGGGETFYTAALDDPPNGAIHVASVAEGRRVVLLITDGGGTGDPQAIGRLARGLNVTIHVLSITRRAEPTAREIARETGGMIFEELKETADIDHAIDSLANIYRADGRCLVRWMSSSSCVRERAVAVTLGRTEGTGYYVAPGGSTRSLQMRPPVVLLSPSPTPTATAVLQARGGTVRIARITTDHPDLAVDPSGPLTIADGDSIWLTITLTRPDSAAFVARIVVESDACRPVLSAVRKEGKPKFSIPTVLRLDRPNGGETFVAGAAEQIAWHGSRGLPVNVDISLDDGTSWKRIADEVNQGMVTWLVPIASSDACLARASIDTVSPPALFRQWDAASLFFSDDASVLIGRHRFRGMIDIRSTDDGRLIDRLVGSEVVGIEEGGSLVHLLDGHGVIESWSIERGVAVERKDLAPLDRHGLYSFTPDLRWCATTDWIGRDSTIITMWSLETFTPVHVHRLRGILAASIAPHGTQVLARPIFGDTIGRLIGDGIDRPLSLANAIGFRFQRSGDHRLWYALPVGYGLGNDSTLIVSIDMHGGADDSVGPIAGTGTAFDVTDDGTLVVVALDRTDRHDVLVMNNNGIVEQHTVDRNVHDVAIDPAARRYALAREDSTVEVRWITGAYGGDTSDGRWSIVAPSLRLTPRDTSGPVGHLGAIRVESLSTPLTRGSGLRYRFNLVVDPPLLLPTKDRWWMENDRRVIEITSTLDDTTGRHQIDVIPLLGSADRARITIANVQWIGSEGIPVDTVTSDSATFTILGICPANDARLTRDGVDPAVCLLQDDYFVVVEWQGLDDKEHRFRLYSILGELIDCVVVRGSHGRVSTRLRNGRFGPMFVVVDQDGPVAE